MGLYKRIAALLLLLLLGVSLCACGKDDGAPYRVLAVAGEKQYGIVYRLGDKIADPVERAMRVLTADGELSRLSSAWLGEDRIEGKGDAEALAGLEEESGERTLIVGVESDFAPLASAGEDGVYTGMSVDIAYAIGRVLGWEIRIQPISSGELGTQLDSGNIDCALGFGLDTISAKAYTVGEPYMRSEILVAVPRESGVRSLRGLSGEKIGTVKDDAVIACLESSEKLSKLDVSVTAYLSPRRCLSALEKSWCVAIAMDELMLREAFS